MIGNDIIDLSCTPTVTPAHLKKYYSPEELGRFGMGEYWAILALKESAWKCANKLIGLKSFIPPRFTVNPEMSTVEYGSLTLPVILLEENEEFIHSIVGTRGVTDWKVCGIGEHRTSFEGEYFRRNGIFPDVVKVELPSSPNGWSYPIIMNDPRTSVTFSHDGRFSSFAYKTVG